MQQQVLDNPLRTCPHRSTGLHYRMPQTGEVRVLGLRNIGLAPGVGHAAAIADEVEGLHRNAGSITKKERPRRIFRCIHDEWLVRHLLDRAVQPGQNGTIVRHRARPRVTLSSHKRSVTRQSSVPLEKLVRIQTVPSAEGDTSNCGPELAVVERLAAGAEFVSDDTVPDVVDLTNRHALKGGPQEHRQYGAPTAALAADEQNACRHDVTDPLPRRPGRGCRRSMSARSRTNRSTAQAGDRFIATSRTARERRSYRNESSCRVRIVSTARSAFRTTSSGSIGSRRSGPDPTSSLTTGMMPSDMASETKKPQRSPLVDIRVRNCTPSRRSAFQACATGRWPRYVAPSGSGTSPAPPAITNRTSVSVLA